MKSLFVVVGVLLVVGVLAFGANEIAKGGTQYDLTPAAPVASPAVAAKPTSATKFVEEAPTPPTPAPNEWHFGTDKDSLTDEVITFVAREGVSEERGMLGKSVPTALLLHCNSNPAKGFAVQYFWGEGKVMMLPEFGEEKFGVSYRFNDDPSQDAKLPPMRGNSGVWLYSNDFLRVPSGTFTVRASGMNDERLTTTFDLTGLADALAKLPCVKSAETTDSEK